MRHEFRDWLAVGIAAMMVEKLTVAEAAMLKAQTLAPSEPAPYVNLTEIYLNFGDTEQATTWCRGVQELNPHIPWEELPVTVVRDSTPWPTQRRLAGVSSFGAKVRH